MYFFISPLTSQTINGQQVNAPEYVSSDMAGLTFSCIPMGLDGYGLISLSAPNPALSAESDIFTFPFSDQTLLTDDDISAVSTYFPAANIPYSWAVAGTPWSAVLQQVAQIFLLAQSIAGTTGSPIFTSGVTLDSTVVSVSLGSGAGAGMGVGGSGGSQQSGLAAAAGSTAGPFDLSDVQGTDIVSDTLISVSQQFTAPILIGGTQL